MRDEFLYKAQGGKDAVTYAGLLNEAHDKGLISIITDLIQIPSDENKGIAISKATATMRVGEVTKIFTGIGDASFTNVGKGMGLHIIRMSETRAKARALRDAVNIGMVCYEELGEDDHTQTSKPVAKPAAKPVQNGRPANWRDDPKAAAAVTNAVQPQPRNEPLPSQQGDLITPEQVKAIVELCSFLTLASPADEDLGTWTRASGRTYYTKHGVFKKFIEQIPTDDPAAILPDQVRAILRRQQMLGDELSLDGVTDNNTAMQAINSLQKRCDAQIKKEAA